jgi:hypothetical protein
MADQIGRIDNCVANHFEEESEPWLNEDGD